MSTLTLEELLESMRADPGLRPTEIFAIRAAIRERDELKRELNAFHGVVMQRLDARRQEERADRAEAELAALWARLTAAPRAYVRDAQDPQGVERDYVWFEATDHAAIDRLRGRRVLLVEDDQ